jgi:hypothetical protein
LGIGQPGLGTVGIEEGTYSEVADLIAVHVAVGLDAVVGAADDDAGAPT